MPKLRPLEMWLESRQTRAWMADVSLSIFGKMKCVWLALLLVANAAQAEERAWQGSAFGISNDSIGEGRDRWQSSSVQFGMAFGEDWTGRAPLAFGELLEFRVRSDILTPEALDVIVPSDRRHAGVLAFGVHSYAKPRDVEMRIGADLVVIGPQTGLYNLQTKLHELLGFTIPALDGFEIEDTVRVDFSGEIARRYALRFGELRPFVEAQVGSEDFIRAGFDIHWGSRGRDDLMMRSTATGQRLAYGLVDQPEGFSFMVGADVAWVESSVFLPSALGYELTPLRKRIRGGVHYEAERFDVFYGLTWLEPEFEAQRTGQFVGTLQFGYQF